MKFIRVAAEEFVNIAAIATVTFSTRANQRPLAYGQGRQVEVGDGEELIATIKVIGETNERTVEGEAARALRQFVLDARNQVDPAPPAPGA